MNSRIWTKVITNSTFTITEDMGFVGVSFVLTTGAATFIGDLNTPSASAALSMTIGLPVVLNSKSNSPLSGIVIDASAGTVEIMGQQ